MKRNFKFSIIGLLSIVVLTLCFTLPAFAASSKFAAHVRDPGMGAYLLHSGTSSSIGDVAESDDNATILHSIIKTANKKDLLIGVSLQSAIYTNTNVKGKSGSAEEAEAMAGVMVEVMIDGQDVYPAKVIFAKRIQELTAVLGGVIESCVVSCDYDPILDETTCDDITIAEDCTVTEEEIGLILNTTSANHFNFVAPNLEPGEHEVQVKATALSSVEVVNGVVNAVETAANEAESYAIVEIGSLTVEEVRATNNPEGVIIEFQ